MIRWLVLCGVVCSGCDVFFQVHQYDHDAAVDAPVVVPCSKMSMLADDFTNPDISIMWPVFGGVFSLGNAARFDMKNGSFRELRSDRFYDLRDDHFQLAVATTDFNFNGGDSVEIIFESQRTGYGLVVTFRGGLVKFSRIEANVTMLVGTMTYDPVQHYYWRVANANNVTTFETSPDDQNFTVSAMYPNLDYVGFMRVRIVVNTAANPGFYLDIANVNGGTPSGRACKMSDLNDRFDGPEISEQWARSDGTQGGVLSQHDGYVAMEFSQVVRTNVYLVASTIYDLTDGAFSVETPRMVDTTTIDQGFAMRVTSAIHDIAQFNQDGGTLDALETTPAVGSDVRVGSKPYDPIAHRWLRIRNQAGLMLWETSPDGLTWSVFGSINNLHGFDRTDAVFQINGMTTVPGELHLDNLDLPPP